jgi:hypothetical protein
LAVLLLLVQEVRGVYANGLLELLWRNAGAGPRLGDVAEQVREGRGHGPLGRALLVQLARVAAGEEEGRERLDVQDALQRRVHEAAVAEVAEPDV